MDILHTRLGAMNSLLMVGIFSRSYFTRVPDIIRYIDQTELFTSGIVLIVNMWYSSDNGKGTDQTEDLEALRKCMKIAKDSERMSA
jgi:hypothetical protein